MPGGVFLTDLLGNWLGGAGAANINVSSGNVAAAPAVATMPAIPGKTNFVTGLEITGGGATTGALVLAALSGLLGGTLSYVVGVVTGATLPNAPVQVSFNPPLPASAVNTAIVLTVPSLGVGNTNAIATLHGYAY